MEQAGGAAAPSAERLSPRSAEGDEDRKDIVSMEQPPAHVSTRACTGTQQNCRSAAPKVGLRFQRQ